MESKRRVLLGTDEVRENTIIVSKEHSSNGFEVEARLLAFNVDGYRNGVMNIICNEAIRPAQIAVVGEYENTDILTTATIRDSLKALAYRIMYEHGVTEDFAIYHHKGGIRSSTNVRRYIPNDITLIDGDCMGKDDYPLALVVIENDRNIVDYKAF